MAKVDEPVPVSGLLPNYILNQYAKQFCLRDDFLSFATLRLAYLIHYMGGPIADIDHPVMELSSGIVGLLSILNVRIPPSLVLPGE